MFKRRVLISTVASISVAGCLRTARRLSDQAKSPEGGKNTDSEFADRSDDDGDGIANSRDDFPKDPEYFALVNSVSKKILLEPGEYTYYKLSPDGLADIVYSAETIDGSQIDVFITDENNVEKMEEQTGWRYYEKGSKLNIESASVSLTVGAGRTYCVVFDNSAIAQTTPSNRNSKQSTTVKIDLKLKRRSAPVGN